MGNLAGMLLALAGGYGLARLAGAEAQLAGRIGIAAVFLFTAVGHFARPEAMRHMLPPQFPARRATIWWSGVLEILFALGVLNESLAGPTGVVICVFLVLVTPVNIYAAVNKVAFGGHAAGAGYLVLRLPLQALLVVWTWWFVVRPG